MNTNEKTIITQSYDSVKTEYLIMREEIKDLFERKSKLETTLFSVYSLILAYLLSNKDVDPIAFLVPVGLVMICYRIKYNISRHIWRGASYCIVYFTEWGFGWEKILSVCRSKDDRENGKKHSRFGLEETYHFALCLICFFLFSYKNDYSSQSLYISFIFLLGLFFAFFFKEKLGMPHYSKVFKEEQEKWLRAFEDITKLKKE